jgi:hypothetical protein
MSLDDLGLAAGNTWAANQDLALWSAHLEHGQVAITAGTRLRAEQSVAAANIWSHTVLFRLFVLDGAHTGDCVWLETDDRADLTRAGLRRAWTIDEYWGMGPSQAGSEAFRCETGGATMAHLYRYAGDADDPDYPRCGIQIPFARTRPAVFGDSRCWECERWYEMNVWMPMVA